MGNRGKKVTKHSSTADGALITPQIKSVLKEDFDWSTLLLTDMATYGSSTFQGGEESAYGGMGSSFSDKAIRLNFIRKVYSILTVQLIVTMGFIGFFFIPTVAKFSQENPALLWVALAFSIIMMLALVCVPSIRRKSPHSLIFLGLFTLCEGWLIGAICSTYEVTEVLIAVGMTAGVVFALTLFAMQTRTTRLVFAIIGAIIFSLYIVFDTQMMMGGNHKYSLDPEEYVFAALNLYLDIINLFLYILQIVGASRD